MDPWRKKECRFSNSKTTGKLQNPLAFRSPACINNVLCSCDISAHISWLIVDPCWPRLICLDHNWGVVPGGLKLQYVGLKHLPSIGFNECQKVETSPGWAQVAIRHMLPFVMAKGKFFRYDLLQSNFVNLSILMLQKSGDHSPGWYMLISSHYLGRVWLSPSPGGLKQTPPEFDKNHFWYDSKVETLAMATKPKLWGFGSHLLGAA